MVGGGDSMAIVVVVDGAEVVLRCDPTDRVDLSFVDAVARLCRWARRAGGDARLRNPTPSAVALIDLCGLSDLLLERSAPSGQALGQAEVGEQLGVQEVVEGDDPAG